MIHDDHDDTMTLNHSGPHVMSQLPRPLWKHPKRGVFTKLFLYIYIYILILYILYTYIVYWVVMCIYIHILVGHTLRVMVEDGLLHVYHAWFCGRIGFLTLLPGSVRSLVPRHYWRWAFWAVLSKTCREPTMVKKGQIKYHEPQCWKKLKITWLFTHFCILV
jgi:hypothetical protein